MIFFDNASTTKARKEALDVFNNFNENYFYNPSAIYKNGQEVSKLINKARADIINCLGGGRFDNFIFTSGATEANNMVLKGLLKNKNSKILVSIVEHPSVYNVAVDLKNQGYNVELVKVKSDGRIDEEDFLSKIDENTALISIMHVNNETGAINDIKRLVSLAKSKNKNVIFHCDGVQAFGKVKVNVSALGVDLYTISSHKINGLKGIGGLYVKTGINIKPLIIGGGQEKTLRSGTENTAGIYSFATTCKLAVSEQEEKFAKTTSLKDKMIKGLEKINNVKINLPQNENVSPYILSISVLNGKAETILNMLEDKGIIVGNGSACSSKHKDNRILSSMGIKMSEIEGSLRVSFSSNNTEEDVDYFITEFENVVNEYLKSTNRRN